MLVSRFQIKIISFSFKFNWTKLFETGDPRYIRLFKKSKKCKENFKTY